MDTKKILIVDDEPSIRIMLSRMIETFNHEVFTAEDGLLALEMCGKTPFDLIISDLKMPRMDGLTLLEKIREIGQDTAFIILTGHGDLPQAMKARQEFHISNFLIKPIHSMDQFLFDVDSALSRRELERENRSLLETLRKINTELEIKVDERTRELVEKNEELGRLSNFRADVLRVLGHELRTPLAILAGYHHFVSGETAVDREVIQAAMGSSIARLQERVEKALSLLKGSRHTQFPLNLETVHPRALCQTVSGRISPLVASRHIGIELVEPVFDGECLWDAEKMEAVIEELLVNAVRASPDGSVVEISVTGHGEEVELQVRDYGTGIPEDQRERIFEPFVILNKAEYHSSGTFERGAAGIGIGLSTARMWTDLHHGSIRATDHPGQGGATLTVRVPREVSLLAKDWPAAD